VSCLYPIRQFPLQRKWPFSIAADHLLQNCTYELNLRNMTKKLIPSFIVTYFIQKWFTFNRVLID
ncbi:MAG: hypothetical protein CMD81_10710, partial [Gammaproteobacteria bacterium]|nr:hypothetical protein [Gammaproteobacteria bacterium]